MTSKPPKMLEAQFQHTVLDLAAMCGYKRHHCRTCRTASGGYLTAVMGEPGFPDLTLAHPKRPLLILELKTDTGRVESHQADWLSTLDGLPSAIDVFLWRPRHWDEIVKFFNSHIYPEDLSTWKAWK